MPVDLLKAVGALASVWGFICGHFSKSLIFSLQVCHLPGLLPHIWYLTSDLALVILFLILKTLSPLAINFYLLMCGFLFFAMGSFVI